MIRIAYTIGLSTIQDLGRDHNYRHGVSIGGAMDRLALEMGNALLGNNRSAAAIEVTLFPIKFEILANVNIAVTGADCSIELDGQQINPNWAFHAVKGQTLSLSKLNSGSFAYVHLAGGIDVPEVLGSRSTYLRCAFGGVEGRMLRSGDVIHTVPQTDPMPPIARGGFGAIAPDLGLTKPERAPSIAADSATILRYLPAAEHDNFDDASLDALVSAPWQITPQSSRAGYRLAGPNLSMIDKLEMRSHGIVPGVIQVPPGGAPIIQTADSQTSGGYPKIGTVIEPDMWRLAQTRIGNPVRFQKTTYEEALAAHREMTGFLDKLRALSKAYRDLLK
ncbi:biotin-dependent carboxyltransferase family protein [uncultured Cohaesibacter sp.]|uniref:5-oxoprolinase subunit C family protein n=1 Tax=uncultured Cohaesibacter sp. TaxID=1002546 RepID=UPI00292CE160|nr:biotin-dependent carboxyltransferase family protein [uncultured Cohaesibacter sp.]